MIILLSVSLKSFKFQYDNTLRIRNTLIVARKKLFKFQYDNTLRKHIILIEKPCSLFKFQYDNTLRNINIKTLNSPI